MSEWTYKFAVPVLNDAVAVDFISSMARKRAAEVGRLRKMLADHKDLAHGTMFPDTDLELVNAIIMRYLHDNIFQKTLYGAFSNCVEALNFVEQNMQNNVHPRRGKHIRGGEQGTARERSNF